MYLNCKQKSLKVFTSSDKWKLDKLDDLKKNMLLKQFHYRKLDRTELTPNSLTTTEISNFLTVRKESMVEEAE